MINLGSTNITEMHLGSTEIWDAFLGENHVYEVPGTRLYLNNGNRLIESSNVLTRALISNKYKSNLIKCKIGKNVTSIDQQTFAGCTLLTDIIIPDNTTAIGENAFANCSGLLSVQFSSNMNNIPKQAFQSCSKLQSVTIPSNINTVNLMAFYGCTSLTSLTMQDGVSTLRNSSFDNCTSLTSITIPKSVSYMGQSNLKDNPFTNCPAVTTITVDPDNTTFDSRNNCNAIMETSDNTLRVGCKNTIIPNDTATIGYDAFKGCSTLTSITIPESVRSIKTWAFAKTGLVSLFIPRYVNDVGGQNPFSGCDDLETIVVDPNNTYYNSKGNCNAVLRTYNSGTAYEYDSLVIGCKNTTFPSTLKYISGSAFHSLTSITSITIPGNVESIGSGAFYGCTNLESVVISEGVQNIWSSAFYSCRKLTSVTLPSTITSIGGTAFGDNSSLQTLTIKATNIPSLPDSGARICPSRVTIYVPPSKVEDYKNDASWSIYASQIEADPNP